MDTFLHKRTMEGVANRYGCKASAKLRKRAERQVERELALIAKLGLAGYFLIVWDIVEFCRKNGMLVQGRGSAANSAVCYSLGITAVDPVGMDLLFERFSRKFVANGRTSTSICPQETTVSGQSSTSTSAMASLARLCAPTSSLTEASPRLARPAKRSASTSRPRND